MIHMPCGVGGEVLKAISRFLFYLKGDELKYLIIFVAIFLISGCASKGIDLQISNGYEISALTKVTKIIKSGDFIAVIGGNNKKLAITENFTLDFGQEKINSKDVFYKIYNETEDRSTHLGKIINEFRIGLGIKGYISKKMHEKANSTVFVWTMADNKFIAIVNDNKSGYFLNIIGENVDQSKILDIIK